MKLIQNFQTKKIMETNNFKKLLLRSAFHCMTCDGEIHEKELEVIYSLSNESKYFLELEIKKEIDSLTQELKESTRGSFLKYFDNLRSYNLDTLEQFQVIEVVLRIIYADKKIDDNEVLFLKKIISSLGILPEMLQQRFGSINTLLDLNDYESMHVQENPSIKDFDAPAFADLKGAEILPIQKEEGSEEKS